jgi:hypothetical protein
MSVLCMFDGTQWMLVVVFSTYRETGEIYSTHINYSSSFPLSLSLPPRTRQDILYTATGRIDYSRYIDGLFVSLHPKIISLSVSLCTGLEFSFN